MYFIDMHIKEARTASAQSALSPRKKAGCHPVERADPMSHPPDEASLKLVVSAICFLSGIYSCLLHLTYTFSDSSRAEPSKGEAFERSEKSLSFAAKDSRFPHICRALLRFPHLSFLPPVPYPPLRGTFPVRGLTIRENH